jgi:hypothetical protein
MRGRELGRGLHEGDYKSGPVRRVKRFRTYCQRGLAKPWQGLRGIHVDPDNYDLWAFFQGGVQIGVTYNFSHSKSGTANLKPGRRTHWKTPWDKICCDKRKGSE